MTDRQASKSDLDIERARLAEAFDRSLARQRGETEHERDGGREL